MIKKIGIIFSKTIDLLFVKHYSITMKGVILIALIIVYQVFVYVNAEVFYYADKDTAQIFKERHNAKRIGSESKMQAMLRNYLSGSNEYKGRIPFTSEVSLLNINHDIKNKVLILNWNSYFYKALENKNSEQDITMLLKTIQENYNVNTLYFLVEGANLNNIFWNDFDLGAGLPLTNMIILSNKIK